MNSILYAQFPAMQWAINLDSNTAARTGNLFIDKSGNFYDSYFYSDSLQIGTTFLKSKHQSNARDIAFAKYDKIGNPIWVKQFDSIVYSAFIGGVFSNNDIIITGGFMGIVDFDFSNSNYLLNATNGSSFIMRLDSNGNFKWAKQFDSYVHCATIDQHDQIYLGGGFVDFNTDFAPGPAVANVGNINNPTNPANNAGGYILKLDANGNFIWVRHFEQSGTVENIVVTPNQDIYISGDLGFLTSDLDPGPNTDYYTKNAVGSAPFFCKLDSNGSSQWARSIITKTIDNFGHNINIDHNENLYIAGNFNDTVDFDPGLGTATVISNFSWTTQSNSMKNEIYLLKLDKFGNFTWVKHLPYLGPSNNVADVWSIEMDKKGHFYISGVSNGDMDFDPDAAVKQLDGTAYVAKFDTSGNHIWSYNIPNCEGGALRIIDEDQYLYSGIILSGPGIADIDPGSNTHLVHCGFNKSVPFHSYFNKKALSVDLIKRDLSPLILFPNPTLGTFFIKSQSKILNVKCYNIIGEPQQIRKKADQIELLNDTPGTYLIKTITKDGIYSNRIIVK